MNRSVYKQALRFSLPICIGYLPVAISFGVLFTKLGFPWAYAALSGLIVYTGSGQLLSVELMAVGTSPLAVFVAIMVMNLRHLFYGPSLISRYQGLGSIRKFYLIFCLTDETFATLSARRFSHEKEDRLFCTLVSTLNHFWWSLGCLMGGYLGSKISIQIKGLSFALSALFIVLLVEQILQRRKWRPFLLALTTGCLGLFFYPLHMLMASLAMVMICLIGYNLIKLRIFPRKWRHYGH